MLMDQLRRERRDFGVVRHDDAVSQVVAALAKNAELAQVIFCCFDDETYRIYSELIAAE